MSMSIKERFNLFLKKTEQQPSTFDQSSFELKLFGGPTQANLIRLEAELINPEKFSNKGIQLNCKWFNKTEKDLVQIDGTLGQNHYQPSLKDIGTIIRVECFPSIQGKTYEGMPIHRDIGPLILEKQTEEDAQEFVQSGSATLLVRVVRSSKSAHYSEIDGLVKVTPDEISVKTKQGDDFLPLFSSKIDEHFPSYNSDCRNHKLLKITFSQTEFAQVLVQQPRMRDVLVLASKMLAGKKIMDKANTESKQDEEEASTSGQLPSPTKKPEDESPTRKKASARDLMQIAQLTKQCKQLSTANESLKKQAEQSKQKQIAAEEKVKRVEQRLQNLSKNYFNIEKQLKELKSKNSSDDDKFLFVNNEVRVLKDQNEHLKRDLHEAHEMLLETQASLKSYKSELDKPTYEQLQQRYNRYKNESQVLSQRLSYAESQHLKYQEQLQFQKQKNEELAYSLDKLNHKYESLLNESKLPTFVPKEVKKHQAAREEEIIRLKLQIKDLVEENDQLRKKCSIKSSQKLQVKSPKKAQLKQLQKLANRLSQAITEKDQIIENMREVNRQLGAKVKSLEQRAQKT